MRFNCGLTKEEQKEWHKHFALFPVRVRKQDCRWLEWVERRLAKVHTTWDFKEYYEYEYRPIWD